MRVVLFIIEYMPPVLLIPRPSSRVIIELYCAHKSNTIEYSSIFTIPDNLNPQTPLWPLSSNTPSPTLMGRAYRNQRLVNEKLSELRLQRYVPEGVKGVSSRV